ncbi:transmembrane protein 8B-like [Liolophura sinensis]|uniref:transmembrane protein 8B-like n=1 Tax=Liolophura sinensis TaxID=3198878 RepID=UPI003158DFF6
MVYQPQPGEWYLAAFTSQTHDKIVQKGLGPKCRYFLEPAISIDIHKRVETLDKRHGSVHIKPNDNKLIRFFLDEPAWEFKIHIIGCGIKTAASISNYLCDITVMSRSSALPSAERRQGEITCTPAANDECILRVASPDVDAWQYLSFTNHGNEDISVQFTLESTVCSGEIYLVTSEWDNSTKDCSVLPELDRYRGYGDFRSVLGVLAFSTVITPQVILYDGLTTVIPFTLEPRLDIGGTLKTRLTVIVLDGVPGKYLVVTGCLQKGSIGFNGGGSPPCEAYPSRQIYLNASEPQEQTGVLYVPYPEPAKWFLSLTMHCYTEGQYNQREACHNMTALVEMDISTSACVDGGCDNSGQCLTYVRGASRFSACNCLSGWRGYGCSDGTEAASTEAQLEEALLLTLSNLFFFPAIILALYRRFYAEALVYFCTMFFSSFYHACDGNRVLSYCITSFDTLSACDFFGSVLSFWVTLTAMLQLKEPYLPTLMMAGAIGLIYGVMEDKHSLWLFVAPAISGVTLLIIFWGLRCFKRRGWYPSWRRYVFFLLPGVVCAGIGISLFAFVETEKNYKYVHSVWHVTMAMSIVFVLPPRPAWRMKTGKTSKKWPTCTSTASDDAIQVISCPDDQQEWRGGIVNVSMTEVSE